MPLHNTSNGGFGQITFFGMVGAVMAALKLKENLDDYRQVSTEEEGRVALTSPGFRDEEDIGMDASVTDGLLDTEIPATARPKRQRAKGCCVCCGINCGLFWKAFGIVFALFALWNIFKVVRWGFSAKPTGLENMPVYSSSLGCVAAPFIYKDAMTTITVPIGTVKSDHALDIRGSAVGTFVIAQGATDATEVKYEMTLRTDDKTLLNDVGVHYPVPSENDPVENSRFVLTTPYPDPSSPSCIRYDITMYIPPNLKTLSVAAHTTTHVQFDPESHIALDKLFVTLYHSDSNNMILPHQNLHASHLALEVYRGWIVGDASIRNHTGITTQRGDGVANVRVHPTPNHDDPPTRAHLESVTGAGRTDIVYISDTRYAHRPISSTHMSSRNGDVYLTYSQAEYNGYIDLQAKSYSARNMQGAGTSQGPDSEQSHWVGDKDGGDTMLVKSRAWVGLYF
jgi:hypothetical protein